MNAPAPDGPPPKPRRASLSAREVRFCQLYAEKGKGHGYECYLDAGFPAKESRGATDVAVHSLLRKPKVGSYIREIREAAAESAKVTIDDLAAGFRRAERADLRRLMGPDGEMLPPSQWPDDVALAISSIEVEELTELQPDPANPRRKKKVAIGLKWKVKLENKTENRKILAQWRRMVGDDKAAAPGAGTQMVIIQGPPTVPHPAPDEPEAAE
jgi:hypothetical protein